MKRVLSDTPSAIRRRRMRRNETPAEKKARLKRRYDAVARFEAMQYGVPPSIRRKLTHETWIAWKAKRREQLKRFVARQRRGYGRHYDIMEKKHAS